MEAGPVSGAVVGRFAPSPSGRLHLGNLACSLLAWLSAKSQGGRIVLRIEDLDAERCPRIYADLLEQDLDWLGLHWDEGGSTGGPHGPYYQSECADIYTAQYKKLEAQGLVYPCFCSRAQLHAASAPHTSDGNVIYPGTCRDLTPAEIAEKRKKKAPAYRVRVPDEDISFVDGCMGEHTENLLHDCGDFYLRRADGVFAYQLAVVVDDARMGVTEVVRGADLLSSTARQLYLYRLLGLQAQQTVQIELPCRGRQQVRPAHHFGDAHAGVVHHHGQLIGKHAVRPAQVEVPAVVQQVLGVFPHAAVHKGDVLIRHPHPVGRGFLFALFGDLSGSQIPAGAGIDDVAVRSVWRTGGVQLGTGAEARVHQPLRFQLFVLCRVDVRALALVVRPVGAASAAALVPVQAKPVQVLLQQVGVDARTAFRIQVLNAQDDAPALALGAEPGQQAAGQIAQMQPPAGAGRKAPDHSPAHRPSFHCPSSGWKMGVL